MLRKCTFLFFCISLTIVFLIHGTAKAQKSIADSLETVLHHVRGSERIEPLHKLSREYGLLNPPQAIKYANEIIDLTANELEWRYYNAHAHMIIGMLDLETANYDDALSHLDNALTTFETIQDTTGIVDVYNSIGTLYEKEGFIEGSLQNYEKAVELARSINDTLGVAMVTNNIGELMFNTGKIDRAIRGYRQAAVILSEDRFNDMLSIPIHNLGKAYCANGMFDSARYYLNLAHQLNIKFSDLEGLAYDHFELGKYAASQQNFSLSLKHYDSAVMYSDRLNLLTLKYEILREKSESHELLNNNDSALYYYKRHILLKDSLFNDQQDRQFHILRTKFDLDQKEKEISLLTAESELQSLELKRRRTVLMLLFGILVMLIILLILLNNMYHQKKDANDLLEVQNDKIQEQNKKLNAFNNQLQDSRRELKRLNATKDKFFTIIAHDLKSPINSISGMINLLLNHSESVDEKERGLLMKRLYKSFIDLGDLTDNLLQWSMSQMGMVPFKPQLINLYELVQDNIEFLIEVIDQKQITVENQIKGDILIYADKNMLNFIIRNILSNAIKFTDPAGNITCSGDQDGDAVQFSITDTGVGMSSETIKKILSNDVHFTSLGTNNEKGTGLGIGLCKEFVERHDGEMTIKSQIGEGTTFTFRFLLRLANQKRSNTQRLKQESP
jgi:signal transduction histidine kinase